MKLIILWTPLSDYMVASFQKLSEIEGVEIVMVYHPLQSIAPYKPFDLSFCIKSYEDKNSSLENIEKFIGNFTPDIIFMASWNYKHYMKLSKKYKKEGVPVISCFDNQWKGSIRQYIGKLISPYLLKPVIDNFIVPGDRQAQLAKKLGYPEPHHGFYCANSNNFKDIKPNLSAKRFVFIGRFVEQKSVIELIEAYKRYRLTVSNPWTLLMIGNGPMKNECINIEGIEVQDFYQPNLLSKKFSESSCFILPSKHENWGLVIHEAALAGLPIICTNACGASTWFLREGQNGYLTATNSKSIMNAMIKIHKSPLSKIEDMSKISFLLGNLWTTDKWALHFYNVLNIYTNKK